MIRLDTKNYCAKVGHKSYPLTPKEFEVLHLLISADGYIPLTQAQKMTLSRVRKKVKDFPIDMRLKIGYKLKGLLI